MSIRYLPALFLLLCPLIAEGVEVSGRYTNLLFHTESLLNQRQTSDLNRLRLTVEGELDRITWEFSYDHTLLYGGVVRDSQYQAASILPDPAYLNLSSYIHRGRSADWKHTLYRGWFQYERD